MKIVLTGSLGNISKTLVELLVKGGHSVTVISSKAVKKEDIEMLGAIARIGGADDVNFLTRTFEGADAVYTMIPQGNFFDPDFNIRDFYVQLGENYFEAIQKNGIKKVIHLSSVGAHTDTGNGLISCHFEVERILQKLPKEVSVKFMRPVGFFTNILKSIPTIKSKKVILSNYENITEPWVSPIDIATAIAEEFEAPFEGRKIKYIASEELHCNEVAQILGKAIGMFDLTWEKISDEQLLNGMISVGMNSEIAEGFVEMNVARRNGILYEDYYRNRPLFGKTKMKDFAIKEFSKAYNG